MKLKIAIEKITERTIGSKTDGTVFITLPRGSVKKGEKVLVVQEDKNTLTIHKNKKISLE